MVTSLSELQAARAILREERIDIPLGIMIEVPAAALAADVLAQEAAFFSIGTNDLTQYTLAVDRGHPRLAAMADALHPAVLRLIRMTAEAGKKKGRLVGVCGGIAGDPQAIPLLIGLGVEELSVAVPAVPAVKAAIRELNLEDCRKLADKALALESAEAVRRLVG
jgi:phosphocarrier protein FPr